MARQNAPTMKEILEFDLPELYEQLARMHFASREIEIQIHSRNGEDPDWERKAMASKMMFDRAAEVIPTVIAGEFSKMDCSSLVGILHAATGVILEADAILVSEDPEHQGLSESLLNFYKEIA